MLLVGLLTGRAHRPLRPRLLILVTSALSDQLCGMPAWGMLASVPPVSDRGVRLGLQEGTRALPLAGCPRELGLGPEQRLAFKRNGWQASLGRPAGKLPWWYRQRCEAGSGTWSTSVHFKGQARRPYYGGATKGLQSASAG